ncbi:MAG: protein kinase family protein with domain, partial [Actinomycetia bacterium]|nr:protein kinase family protein with domain [Actinomycetes bacterium]
GRQDLTGVLPPVPEAKRRRWPWLLLALLVVAGVVGGGLVARSQLAVPNAPVPAVANKPEEEARRLIADADGKATDVQWTVRPSVQEFDDIIPPGVVMSQRPAAGTKLEDGGTITLVVSKGPAPVALPPLDGATIDAAKAAIAAAGLTVGKETPRADEVVPAGTLLDWSVGGQPRPPQAPKRSAVDLVVSSGPEARVIPSLKGSSEADAKAKLESMQLKTAHGDAFSDTVAAGQVITTTPPPGTSVPRGQTVTIIVSKGPDVVVVPDVSKASDLDHAVALLEAAGLQAGQVFGDANGKPFDSDPGAGQQVRRGTTVDIFLRRARR